jgi:hypothetical protein
MTNKEAAVYISEFLLELRNLAKSRGLTTLQGLLEISYYEAYETANRVAVPEGESLRLQEMGNDARRAKLPPKRRAFRQS